MVAHTHLRNVCKDDETVFLRVYSMEVIFAPSFGKLLFLKVILVLFLTHIPKNNHTML